MDQTFISIHGNTPHDFPSQETKLTGTDLGEAANILFVSDSITDILGYDPQQVVGRSGFDFFHPEEVQIARKVYARDIRLDKAAALNYITIMGANGQWISCECCFTIVHDVLVACISIYQRSERSERTFGPSPSRRPLCTYTLRTSSRGPSHSPVVCLLVSGPSLLHVGASFDQI